MDADGQHRPEDIPRLLELEDGYDMVVGARDGAGQANFHRGFANGFYNRLASWMVGHEVKDLTSGFRAVAARNFLEFLYLLPNGFSYPTTITMAFFGRVIRLSMSLSTSSHACRERRAMFAYGAMASAFY